MSNSPNPVTETISGFLETVGKSAEFDASTSLFADGLGLDSLEVAELSVLLEDTHGTDPFSAGLDVTTVGQVLDFYVPSA